MGTRSITTSRPVRCPRWSLWSCATTLAVRRRRRPSRADNDLAVGRIIDYISHSPVWSTSAIFIEEDDAQNGVDHVDGHRSPGYIVSPYVKQGGVTDSTYYTQVNMTRTIEQILGLPPMNQFDLWASPMRTAFVTGTPSSDNFLPWTHVPNIVPLYQGTVASNTPMNPAVKALRAAWLQKKEELFAGKLTKPDAEDPDTVNHSQLVYGHGVCAALSG